MNEDMAKYAQQLRQLVDEYYQQQMPLDVYRTQRKLILDQIELEYTGSSQNSDAQKTTASIDE